MSEVSTRRSLLAAILASAAVVVAPTRPWSFSPTTGHPYPIVDLARYGVSPFSTTGTILARALNQITVADASAIAVGKSIIVAIGGEAGAGARGTVGVGGVWPALSYASTAAMDADRSRPDNTHAFLRTTGDVYIYHGGTRRWEHIGSDVDYWFGVANPQALYATVVAKAGNTLRLSASAAVSVRNAKLYIDNSPAFAAAVAANGGFKEYRWPEGRYAVSAVLGLSSKPSVIVSGQHRDKTTLFSPRGAQSVGLEFFKSNNGQVRQLTLEGNLRFSGYGFDRRYVTQTSRPAFPSGWVFLNSVDGVMRQTRQRDCAYAGATYARNIRAYDHDVHLTEGLRTYTQCQVIYASSQDCWGFNLTGRAPYMTPGFEQFRSTGGGFINTRATNMSMVANSSGGFDYDGIYLTFTAGCEYNAQSGGPVSHMVNINANADPGGNAAMRLGARIHNFRLVVQGYINARNDTIPGVNLNALNVNIAVEHGYVQIPDWAAPSLRGGAVGVASTATGTVVSDVTVVGAATYPPGPHAKNPAPNIDLAPGKGGIARACTAERIQAPVDGGGNKGMFVRVS